ncbi:AraC family transcriptional regulator [Paenibacillus sp. BIHB 4019]|uniref:AraC family transcriptional regulator n=1 Tax=Paenibacillus sp. BIHB 4019 TaxID=1870819 RepID=A0A1B2DBX2_9BACL|nr:AraC family transcriptional regulator [Paenibacillus sp. BIHB 4019]ANY65202.1 AraC family transcriptional regulator [Paenibacillus sp. BIHB 4019]
MDAHLALTADRFPLVRDIGWNQTEELYTHPDRTLDYHVFLYVASGSMQVVEEAVPFLIQAKQYLFLKKGLHHWGRHETAAGTQWYWIHFNMENGGNYENTPYKERAPLPELALYYPDHYQYRLTLPKHGTAFPGMENRLNALMKMPQEGRSHQMTRTSLSVYELFLDLHQASTLERKSTGAEEISERIIAFLGSHSCEPFSARHLAAALNLNYSYLSATFKRVTGQSIIEAHTRLRLQHAVALMRSSSLNISDISDRLGYQNPFYFSRVFKKMYGESPSSYLKQLYRPY